MPMSSQCVTPQDHPDINTTRTHITSKIKETHQTRRMYSLMTSLVINCTPNNELLIAVYPSDYSFYLNLRHEGQTYNT